MLLIYSLICQTILSKDTNTVDLIGPREYGLGSRSLIRENIKCVSKVLGHLSKQAAPTSVPGLLRHILHYYIRGRQVVKKIVKKVF